MLDDGTLVCVAKLGPKYRRVYQGGHHDVYCDGDQHARMHGGFVNGGTKFPALLKPQWTWACDCVRWDCVMWPKPVGHV